MDAFIIWYVWGVVGVLAIDCVDDYCGYSSNIRFFEYLIGSLLGFIAAAFAIWAIGETIALKIKEKANE